MIEKDGMIALQHRTTNPRTERVSDGTVYYFVPKFNVCMGWVQKEHIDELMRLQAKVCCGKKGQRFYYATLVNVNLWETGSRHVPDDADWHKI